VAGEEGEDDDLLISLAAEAGPGALDGAGERGLGDGSERFSRRCAPRLAATPAPPVLVTARSPRTREGNQLRTAARLMARAGQAASEATLVTVALITNLAELAVAAAGLRAAQRHPAQAAAARAAASQLQAVLAQARSPAPCQHTGEAASAATRPPCPALPALRPGCRHGPAVPRQLLLAGLAHWHPEGPVPPLRTGPGR
jgi:hypothetical protein